MHTLGDRAEGGKRAPRQDFKKIKGGVLLKKELET